MFAITRPPHTAAIEGITLIASIREVLECFVYRTSWPLCRPWGALTLRRSVEERRRLGSAENTDPRSIMWLLADAFSAWVKKWDEKVSSIKSRKNVSSIEVKYFTSAFQCPLCTVFCKLLQQQCLLKLLLTYSFSLCLYSHTNTHWCHCQTHVLMAPDIQIFPRLQCAVEVSWRVTVCCTCLLYSVSLPSALCATVKCKQHQHNSAFKHIQVCRFFSSSLTSSAVTQAYVQTSHLHLAYVKIFGHLCAWFMLLLSKALTLKVCVNQ